MMMISLFILFYLHSFTLQVTFDVRFNTTDLYKNSPYVFADDEWNDTWACTYQIVEPSVLDDSSNSYLDLIATSSGCPSACSNQNVKLPYMKSWVRTGLGYYGIVFKHSKYFTTGFCGMFGIVQRDGFLERWEENFMQIDFFGDKFVFVVYRDDVEKLLDIVSLSDITFDGDEFRELGITFNCSFVQILIDGKVIRTYDNTGDRLPDCSKDYGMQTALKADACKPQNRESHYGTFPSNFQELRMHLAGMRYYNGTFEHPVLPYDRSSLRVETTSNNNNNDGDKKKSSNDLNWMVIVFPSVFGSSGIIVIILILLSCFCFCCFCCCCILIFVIILVVICLLLLGGGGGSSILMILMRKKSIDIDGEELTETTVKEDRASALFEQKKDLFVIDWKKVKLVKNLAAGGGGAVIYLAEWGGARKVAFKVFNCTDVGSSCDFEDFERELSVSSSISHPNILRFYGCSLKIPRVGIVMEYCENGDLSDYTILNKGNIDFITKMSILLGIGSGMLYMHNRDIIHRDLKGKNVLLDKNDVPKICDFGLSRVVDRSKRMALTKRVGTCYYIAPEVILGHFYDSKCDIFSYSMVMFELLFENERPFGNDIFAIENRIANNENLRPEIPEDRGEIPDWLIEIMVTSWKGDPKLRPDFESIVRKLEEGIEKIRNDD